MAIIAPNILGSFNSINAPYSFKKIDGNIIAGKTAEGTQANTDLILSFNMSLFTKAIMVILVKQVKVPAIKIDNQVIFFVSILNMQQVMQLGVITEYKI